jgi:hypothetical protein
MVVDNLDLFGPFIRPSEYDPPLIVYADRMPSRQVAAEDFQAISRRRCEITQDGRVVELHQLAARDLGNICRKPLRNASLLQNQLSERPAEALDHC